MNGLKHRTYYTVVSLFGDVVLLVIQNELFMNKTFLLFTFSQDLSAFLMTYELTQDYAWWLVGVILLLLESPSQKYLFVYLFTGLNQIWLCWCAVLFLPPEGESHRIQKLIDTPSHGPVCKTPILVFLVPPQFRCITMINDLWPL